MTVRVLTIDTPGLGNRSYLIHDGAVGVVIDPPRDTERVAAVAEAAGVRISHVAETHIHNDYLSGGLDLARELGAQYLVAADDEVAFDRFPAQHGDKICVGALTLTVVATPGHTPHHLSYIAIAGGQCLGVFTGGSLLYGATGRCDLIDPALTRGLTREQYRSVRRLATGLDAGTPVFPTHGFGSFCAAAEANSVVDSTIGEQWQDNPALISQSESQFVEQTVSRLRPYPTYYRYMAGLNRSGAQRDSPLTKYVSLDQVIQTANVGGWVLDVRPRRDYARSHLPGTLNIEVTNTSFAGYAGWILPWQSDFLLVGHGAQDLGAAEIELSRIGYDRPAGVLCGAPEVFAGSDKVRGYRVAQFEELQREQRQRRISILDVRQEHEWSEGHVGGAVHIPLNELPARAGELPPGEVWVYCRSGMRASAAASMLDDGTRTIVLVDDNFGSARVH